MKSILATLMILSSLTVYADNIPMPNDNERFVYSRAYSDAHMAKHVGQKMQEVKVELYRIVEGEMDAMYIDLRAKDIDGNYYHSDGICDEKAAMKNGDTRDDITTTRIECGLVDSMRSVVLYKSRFDGRICLDSKLMHPVNN